MLTRLHQSITSLGMGNAMLYAVHRLLERASAGRLRIVKYLIVAQPVSNGSDERLRADPGICIECMVADHPLVQSLPRPAAVIAKRYRDGAVCLAATRSGVFAGSLWWQRGSYEEDEVRCLFALTEPVLAVWDFDVYVAPQFRLGRMMARLWQHANRMLYDDGVRWSFSRISAFNPASLAAHSRLGIVRLSSAVFLVAGSFQVALFTQRPFVHLSWHAADRPVLRLSVP